MPGHAAPARYGQEGLTEGPGFAGPGGRRPHKTFAGPRTPAPARHPAEGLWAHLKNSLGNLAPCSLDELAALARTRLKRMQYQPGLLDGFIAETGLILARP